MKKILFSLGFVAASGIYVLAANHSADAPTTIDKASALDTALAPALSTSGASLFPLSNSTSRGPASVPPVVAEVAPPTTPTRIPELPSAPATASVPTSPMPRPRPAAAPATTTQTATDTEAATTAAAGYRDGTYAGSSENAYYGRVQVQVTIANHQIASVKVLDYPQDRRTSRYINSQALPLLKREVIAADNANIDAVSGATLTSEAYIRSLDNALTQAGGPDA